MTYHEDDHPRGDAGRWTNKDECREEAGQLDADWVNAVVDAGPPVEEPPYPDPESDEGAELAEQLRYYELDDGYEYDYDYEPEPYDSDGPWDEEELRTGRWTHNHGLLLRRYES